MAKVKVTPEMVREMVEAALSGDMTTGEIATLMDLPRTTVGNHLRANLVFVHPKTMIPTTGRYGVWVRREQVPAEALAKPEIPIPAPATSDLDDDVTSLLRRAEALLKEYDQRWRADQKRIADLTEENAVIATLQQENATLTKQLEQTRKEAMANLTDALSWREHRHIQHARQQEMSKGSLRDMILQSERSLGISHQGGPVS